MSTYILWDIDGTLIYNTPTAGALYLDAIEHVTGVRPTVPVDDPHGMTEGQLLTAILEVNGLDVGRLGEVLYDLDVLSREQHERGHARDACVGVDAALEAVAERGWTNALLTGNGPNRARYKLLSAGIDPALFDWEHSYFGHESPTRHHLTAGAKNALRTHQAFIIGDTPNDGLAADSAGIPFVAVATGFYSSEQLHDTSAIAVIDDLESGITEALDAVEDALPEEQNDDTDTRDIPIVTPPVEANEPSDDAEHSDDAERHDDTEQSEDTEQSDDTEHSDDTEQTGEALQSEPAIEEDFGENPDVEVSVDEPAPAIVEEDSEVSADDDTSTDQASTDQTSTDETSSDEISTDEISAEINEDFGENPESDNPGEGEQRDDEHRDDEHNDNQHNDEHRGW